MDRTLFFSHVYCRLTMMDDPSQAFVLRRQEWRCALLDGAEPLRDVWFQLHLY